MLSFDEFAAQLADVYEHLYDIVYLRTHPLTDLLIPGNTPRKDKAWQFHHMLINAIQELDPGARVPAFSREWRRHRLMVLRYVDGLTPQVVADQLAISRRHYYRAHGEAIDALASILWSRLHNQAVSPPPSPERYDSSPVDQLELLRLEAAQMVTRERYTRLSDVIQGVITLLHDRAQQRAIEFDVMLDKALPAVSINRELLRQLLMGLFGSLIERMNHAVLRLTAVVQDRTTILSLSIDPVTPIAWEQLVPLEALATLSGAVIRPLSQDLLVTGVTVDLPVADVQRSILVIDDNEDILQLLQRYLSVHHYRVSVAKTAQEALDVMKQVLPQAIILDLMMPDQDGWDLMQVFLNDPKTQSIPIIVCSVLQQKELALSLGATAFMDKPVSEQALLSILASLETNSSS